jgi:dihydroorotase
MTLTAFTNVRLLDPASGRDEIGTLVTHGQKIEALGVDIAIPKDAKGIDCTGLCLAPGLVDMRVAVGEPGEEQLAA